MKKKPPMLPTFRGPNVTGVSGVSVPSHVYVPPVVPPAPPPPPVDNGGVFDGRAESYGKTVQCAPSVETPVCTTTSPWHSLDVYVSGSMTGSAVGTQLTISVYALVRGQRVLVGIGRAPSSLAQATNFRIRCCAVRGPIAERFEVTAHWNDATARTFQIAVIASDQTAAPGDELVGARVYSAAGPVTEIDFPITGSFQGVELLQLTGFNAVAGMTWLQIHELAGAALVVGQTCIWSFPVAQNVGVNLNAQDLRAIGTNLAAGWGRHFGLAVALSSAVFTYNPAGVTGGISCLVR